MAKTISAYDMTVSDTLYGPVKRYVSEERLKGMLDYEFTQLVNRLGPQRGKDTRFFAFCNTVKVKGLSLIHIFTRIWCAAFPFRNIFTSMP